MARYNLFRKKKDGREHGPWWARKRRKGLPVLYLNCQTEDKRSARKRADEWADGLIAEGFGESPKKTFADAAIKMAEEHVPHHRLKTIERYTAVLNRFVDAFGTKKLDEIDHAVLWDYEQRRRSETTRQKKPVSPATIHYEFKVLGILFELADMWGWTGGYNPVGGYRKRRKAAGIKAPDAKTRYYTQEEEDRLLKAAPAVWRNRMIFAVETGLRKNEQFGLTWDEMDVPGKKLTVLARLAKGKRARDVPLTPRAITAAKAMRMEGSPWVCPREDGGQFSPRSIQVWRRMQAFGKAAGVAGVDWHAWRKTCGCRLLQVRRFSMEAVQHWLGHRTIKETENAYAFLHIEQLQEMVHETQGRTTRVYEVTKGDTRVIEQIDKHRQISYIKP
jgi:integrase/recombinase XerD